MIKLPSLLAGAILLTTAALSQADTFYVVGSGDDTILRYTGAGLDLGSFSTETNAPTPVAVAVDANGIIYVTNDQATASIEKYAPDGTDLGLFSNANLVRTYGLTFDGAGNLYAANFGNGSIRKFSPEGLDLGAFASGIAGPVGLAFDGNGRLYVANYSNNTVTRFSAAGAPLGTFATTGLATPFALAFDSVGNLYVSNIGTNTVTKYAPDGTSLGLFARTGMGPTGLVFDRSGNLYVANEQDHNVQKFSPTGASLGVFVTTPAGSAPAAIALSIDSGNIQFTTTSYSVDEDAGTVNVAVRRNGTLAASVNYATEDGQAIAGQDYTAVSGTLTWTSTDPAVKTIQIPITNRALTTGGVVSFSVNLTPANTGTNLGVITSTIVSITQSATPAAPAVTFSSPPTDLTVTAGATVPLAVSVTDPAGVITRVQFSLDDNKVTNVPAPGPYIASITAPTVVGAHTLTVTAMSPDGNVFKSQRNLTVVAADPALPAPTSVILANLNGRLFAAGSELPITVSATSGSDSVALDRVDFYADGVLFATSSAQAAPASAAVAQETPVPDDSTFVAIYPMPGSTKLVNILVVALDKLGRSQVSAPVSVQSVAGSRDTPPAVAVGDPNLGLTDGAPVGVFFALNVPVSVVDPDAIPAPASAPAAPVRRVFDTSPLIAKVEYFLNTLKAKPDEQAASALPFTASAEGTYAVTVVATDGAGLATVSRPLRLKAVTPVTASLAAAGDGIGNEGGKKAKALFSRSGAAIKPLTVLYKVGGSAKNGKDYLGTDGLSLSGAFTIPGSAVSAKLKIVPTDDAKVEGTETLNLKLLPSPTGAYTLGTSIKAKLLIEDND